MDEEADIITGVKPIRYSKKGDVIGYTLFTERYPDGYKIHPFVHKLMLNGEKLGGYAKLLKEYLEDHPEIIVLVLLAILPISAPAFLKSLLIKKLSVGV